MLIRLLTAALVAAALAGVIAATLPAAAQGGTQTINLQAGYNLVGLSVVPANTAPAVVFAPLITVPAEDSALESVFAYSACEAGGTWRSYVVGRPVNSLAAVTITQGLWVKMRSPATLTVSGTLPVYPLTIHLCPGDNLVGYPSGAAKAIKPLSTGALASIDGQWSQVFGEYNPVTDAWRSFVVGRPINSLSQMKPGVGYWLKATAETDLEVSQ